MDIGWHFLARITLAHGFYSSGRAPLQFAPTPDSAAMMARLGLRLRHAPAGQGHGGLGHDGLGICEGWYSVHGPPDSPAPQVTPLLQAGKDDVLTLTLQAVDRDFAVVSGFGDDATGVRCFGNAATRDIPEGNMAGGTGRRSGRETGLTTGRRTGNDLYFTPPDGTPYPPQGPVLSLSLAPGVTVTSLPLTRVASGAETVRVAVSPPVAKGGAPRVSARPDLASGLYRPGAADAGFVYLNHAPAPFGLIELSLTNPAVPATERLVLDARQIQPQTYLARIAARKTHWQYICVGLDDDMASVTGGPAGTSFGVAQAQRVEGAAALVFTSAQALPMMQAAAPPWPATLSYRRDGQVQKLALPIPAPAHTRLQSGPAGARWVSPMVIYI